MRFTIFGLLAAVPLALAAEDTRHRLLPRDLRKVIPRDLQGHKVFPAAPALRSSQPDQLTIQIPIDHSSSNSKTFSNRYWINATYYQAGGPVFLQDIGESTVTDDYVQSYLMEAGSASAVMQLAQKYNGLGLMIEHRFYGESQPFPVDETTGLPPDGYDAWKYHTTEQALEDAVYIANNFKPSGLDQYWDQLSPSQAPWVFIGGSYPGNRAAWARIRNPDVFYAAWSSSAPVETRIDMASYYEQVYQDMTANCSADMAAASNYLTKVLTSGSDTDKAVVILLSNLAQQPMNVSQYTSLSDQEILTAYKGANQSDWGVAYNIANFVGPALQSYGFDLALLPYCSVLEGFNPDRLSTNSISSLITTIFRNPANKRPTAKGIAATYSDQDAFYAIVFGIYQQYLDAYKALSGNVDTGPVDYSALRDGISWTYQTCTEFGYYQVANTSSPYNLLSEFINVTAWQQYQCDENFASFSTFPSSPDTQKLVDRYGGWNMNPSQVMFTNGLKDPWHTLGVQSTNTEIGAPNRQTTQTVPACGAKPDGNQVFGLAYKNGYHVSDLLGSTGYAAQGMSLFERALDTWLPCFQKHSINSNNTASNTTPETPTNTRTSTSASTPTKTGGAGALLVSKGAQLGMIAAVLAAVALM